MQTVHRQAHRQIQVVSQAAEVAGQQQLDRGAAEHAVGGLIGLLPGRRQLLHQRRLIELDPLHALFAEAGQQLAVDRQQRLEQRQAIEGLLALLLAQPEPGERPEQAHLHRMPQGLGLGHLVEEARGGQAEALPGVQLGHQVVVVGIEILGHLAGGGGLTAGGPAPSHAKGGIQPHLAGGDLLLGPEARRHRPQGHGEVQHLVVEGEIPHGDQVEPRLALGRPVAGAQLTAGAFQPVTIEAPLPVGLDGPLELAVGADTRIAQNMR